MNKNINVQEANNGKVTVRIKDYFPDDKSGIELFEVSMGAYEDLCEYKCLISSVMPKDTENTVEIDVRDFYPHLCKKQTKVSIYEDMYLRQLRHIKSRKFVLAKLNDLQPNYVNVPNFMEIKNELCMELSAYRKEDNEANRKYKRRYDGIGFDEVTRGEIDGLFSSDNTTKIELFITIKNLFEPYGEILCRRAVLYIIFQQSVTQIARIEGVSPKSTWESINKVRKIVRSVGKEYFGLE